MTGIISGSMMDWMRWRCSNRYIGVASRHYLVDQDQGGTVVIYFIDSPKPIQSIIECCFEVIYDWNNIRVDDGLVEVEM
jgi:hypothetical protein